MMFIDVQKTIFKGGGSPLSIIKITILPILTYKPDEIKTNNINNFGGGFDTIQNLIITR